MDLNGLFVVFLRDKSGIAPAGYTSNVHEEV